jgi:hypothetical protein
MEGGARRAALAALCITLVVAIAMVLNAGRDSSSATELENNLLGMPMAPGSGKELNSYASVLSFEGHGDDGHDPDASKSQPRPVQPPWL